MSDLSRTPNSAPVRTLVRIVGQRLRAELADPEAEPLPYDHVDLLLQLRHKERARERQRQG